MAHASHHGFRHGLFDPNRDSCWKGSLRQTCRTFAKTGRGDRQDPRPNGEEGRCRRTFPLETRRCLKVLRMEPYLRSTATRHPDFAGRLNVADRTTLATRSRAHAGRCEPKNICRHRWAPSDSQPRATVTRHSYRLRSEPHWLLKSEKLAAAMARPPTWSVSSRSSLATETRSIGSARSACRWSLVRTFYFVAQFDGKSPVVHHHRCPEGECKTHFATLIASRPVRASGDRDAWYNHRMNRYIVDVKAARSGIRGECSRHSRGRSNTLAGRALGRAIAPAGASRGMHCRQSICGRTASFVMSRLGGSACESSSCGLPQRSRRRRPSRYSTAR